MRYALIITTAFLFAFAMYAPSAAGQMFSGEDAVRVDVSPRIPGPNTEVSLSLSSGPVDLNRSTVTWLLDGETMKRGVGATEFSFTTGALGTSSRVSVVIATRSGGRIAKNLSFDPAEVDLLWEADTYTPPFYKGKALPSAGSTVTFTAIPHFVLPDGSRVAPENVIYTWMRGRKVLGSKSGFGRQTLTAQMPGRFQDAEITVEASSLRGTFTARKILRIPTAETEVLFYERVPLLGILYRKALSGTVPLLDEEMTLRAEPYFFSRGAVDSGDVGFEWKLNREPFSPPAAPNEVVFRKREGESGRAFVELAAKNSADIFQDARNSLYISFGERRF